ncbi:MAG TPA: PAS domain S-box protein [Polyangiaceae bacterium]|nr:MAG: Transcriptional regulatory protein SrrA [Deltaproteobacteria bacterium ADurb.Bin207]HNZ24442.1 PAS domain S-box protein [Polyangiaceae bacterium]HOE49187.1 PAS domain S-box protein [Polyangiaceae bacterium]HOH03227.1 PAS domain S-box protein [Polyangiaceae bacterium]HOR36692.1 PAS domain S-box protein [Polyangiaceae bacterium]
MTAEYPVLVVDDDNVSRRVIENVLRHAGIAAVSVAGGNEALFWLETNKTSLVLLDLIMPPPDGYQVLSELRAHENGADIPVVVLTGVASDEEVSRAFEAGADDFVRKPFRAAELVARIRGQLRLRSYIEALAQKEKDAQVVLELTQALASSLDFRQILFTVVQRVADVARVNRCSIVLVQGDVGQVAATSDNEDLFNLSIQLDRYPEIRKVVDSGKPLIIENVTTHPLLEVVRDKLPVSELTSLVLVPIGYEGTSMGVLVLRAAARIHLGDHEMNIAQTVANATAIALRNAHVIKNLQDQTEQVSHARVKAERRLQMLKRYAAFFEAGADGVIVTDLDGQILFTNARARSITGFSETALRGRKVDELVTEVDRPRMSEVQAGFAKGSFLQSVDVQVQRSDGQQVVLSINFSGVLREEGAVLMSFRDVTPERTVEAQLRQTKDFLERVIDSSANAIISIDMHGRVQLFNRAAERCLGRTADQMIGRAHIFDFFPKEEAEAIVRMLQQGEEGASISDHSAQVIVDSGELAPVTSSAALIHDDGQRIGAVVILTDLRDRLRMEAQLAAAQEELESRERQAIIAELAGAAAHELNQPLTSVMGYAELLKRKFQHDSSALSAVDVIMSEAERMAEIVRKIGKITRYETKSYVGAAKILDLDRASDGVSLDDERGDDGTHA